MTDESKKDQADAAQKVNPKPDHRKRQAATAEVSLEDYLSRIKVHMGLVASFRYEARANPELLRVKTEEQWAAALEQQSQAQYE
ncbi:hypothetical protein ABIE27_001980 [Paenibacillus sp. 4624]|uniref:hypothetical protein n=1 Tax=Paenibacillus sp. 4624 TaxID=3156453 RepID=UPI003D220D0C